MINNKNNLFVIMNDYPFNFGEPFFESEVNYLAPIFGKIYIFSLMGKKHDEPTRKCPTNVYCYPLNVSHNRLRYLLKGLTSSDKCFSLKNIKGKKRLMAGYLLGKNISTFNTIKAIIKNNNIQTDNVIIYSYWLVNGIASIKLKMYLSSITKNIPLCISRCHRYDLFSEDMPLNYQPFQKEVIDRLDYVFSCSQFGATYLIDKYPNFDSKINIARLGTFDHGVQNHKNSVGSKMIITCSGLRAVKRLDLFAKAFVELSKKNILVKWICVGDGEEREKILSIIKKANLDDRCVFVYHLKNEDLLRMYKNNYYHCFVNVSKSEGIPVSIMEATSFGMPVIATDVGGNSEIVGNDNGVLLSSDPSINEIVEALEFILNMNEENYQNLRNASRRKWLEKYNAENNYKEWCDILNEKPL